MDEELAEMGKVQKDLPFSLLLELANTSGILIFHTRHVHMSLGKSKYDQMTCDPCERNAEVEKYDPTRVPLSVGESLYLGLLTCLLWDQRNFDRFGFWAHLSPIYIILI